MFPRYFRVNQAFVNFHYGSPNIYQHLQIDSNNKFGYYIDGDLFSVDTEEQDCEVHYFLSTKKNIVFHKEFAFLNKYGFVKPLTYSITKNKVWFQSFNKQFRSSEVRSIYQQCGLEFIDLPIFKFCTTISIAYDGNYEIRPVAVLTRYNLEEMIDFVMSLPNSFSQDTIDYLRLFVHKGNTAYVGIDTRTLRTMFYFMGSSSALINNQSETLEEVVVNSTKIMANECLIYTNFNKTILQTNIYMHNFVQPVNRIQVGELELIPSKYQRFFTSQGTLLIMEGSVQR